MALGFREEDSLTMTFLSVVLPWLLIGFGCWLFSQSLRQNGRILVRLESLQEQLEKFAETLAAKQHSGNGHRPLSESRIDRNGLPVGTHAPDLRLPRLDGGELALSDY